MKCSFCGKEFDENNVGHIDDHVEVCKDCMPRFTSTDQKDEEY